MVKRNRVVITGMGVLAPNGIGLEAFWDSLLNGRSGIGPITLFDASNLKSQIAGEVKNFNPFDYIEPELKPKRMARHTQFAYAATMMALKDAGLEINDADLPSPTPVVVGVSTSAMDIIERSISDFDRHGFRRYVADGHFCIEAAGSRQCHCGSNRRACACGDSVIGLSIWLGCCCQRGHDNSHGRSRTGHRRRDGCAHNSSHGGGFYSSGLTVPHNGRSGKCKSTVRFKPGIRRPGRRCRNVRA